MKTVPRIALAFSWSILPLQSWLVVLGAIILAFGLVGGALNNTAENIGVWAGVGTTGAVFIALVPALAGGAALRFASSKSMLHLRPYGRVRMLSAATLVITAMAALITLPTLLAMATSSRSISPLAVFAVCWSLMATLWIVVFVITSSRTLTFMVLFAPLFIVPAAKTFASAMPGPLSWLAASATAWGLFALWYLQARAFRAPRWFGDRSSQTFESAPVGVLAALLDSSRGILSPQRAGSQLLLGAASPFLYAFVMMAWLVAVLAIMSLIGPGRGAAGFIAPTFLLGMAALTGAQLAYMTTRRARMLWLRAGSDRASLFALAERNGLLAALWSLALLTAGLTVFTLLRRPEQVAPLLLFAAAQIPIWACLFYGGMCLTRGWTVEEIFLFIGLAVLFVVESVLLRPFDMLRPEGVSPVSMSIGVGIAVLLAPLLRGYARRRWLALDWRIARMPALALRT